MTSGLIGICRGKRRLGLSLTGLVVAVACVAVASSPARAQADLPIEAFVGRYVGSGIARNDLSDYFGMTVRDLDVTITARGAGFTVAWTTVIRSGGDPDNPKVKRKSSSASFMATERYGVYRAAEQVNVLAGERLAWARITGHTLIVYSMVIAEDGSYELHQYNRTLSGLGMELEFIRVRDGKPGLGVSAKLIKEAQ